MHKRRTLFALAMLPLMLDPLACASSAEDDVMTTPVAREGEAPMEAKRIELLVPAAHATAEEMTAMVEYLEGQAEVAQAKAAVHKSSETGDADVSVELWGHDMPADDQLIQAIQAEYPYLVDVVVSPIDVEAETPPQDEGHEDPEVLRQQIIDDLRAKGVEGEIDVQIVDHPDGRREVSVEVADDQPPP